MNFEWDKEKNEANFSKHKIRFEEAAQIFKGPVLTTVDDRQDYNEVREISIGQLRGQIYLVVVHTDRKGAIRLISARRAKLSERRRYDDYYQEITR